MYMYTHIHVYVHVCVCLHMYTFKSIHKLICIYVYVYVYIYIYIYEFLHPKSLQMVTAATKLKDSCSLEGKLWQAETAYFEAHITKVHIIKAMVFPVVTYGCKSW